MLISEDKGFASSHLIGLRKYILTYDLSFHLFGNTLCNIKSLVTIPVWYSYYLLYKVSK